MCVSNKNYIYNLLFHLVILVSTGRIPSTKAGDLKLTGVVPGVQRQRAAPPGGGGHGQHVHGGRAADAAAAAAGLNGGHDQRLGHHGLPRPATDTWDGKWCGE